MMQKRSVPTTTRHMSAQVVHRLYDDLGRWHGALARKLRMRVRTEHPYLLDGLKLQRAVLEIVVTDHKDVYCALIDRRAEARQEQYGKSCLELAKGRSGPLNPMGELTGGNYRARF